VRRMLTMLKRLFGGGSSPKGSKPRKGKGRVNLDRRFEVLRETTQGSMSKVVKAVDSTSGAVVCLKVQNAEKNAAASARAHRENRPDEGEIGAKIIHPNVVRTHDWGVSSRGEQFLVMEFVDGVTFDFLRENGTVPKLRDKLELLAQAADGLAAVHEAGFIHHDINPRNFLIDRDRRVKLIDFGLTVPNTPEFRRPGNRTGTLNYMAPELIRRESIDEKIDVFAFGALAFEFLTGRLPFDSAGSMQAMLQRLNAEPLDPAVAKPDLPKPLHELLRKLTARRKDDRLRSLSKASEALRAIASKC